MNALTKAIDHSRGVVTIAHDNALRLKREGLLNDSISAGGISFLGDMRGQQRDREGYAAFKGWLYSCINAIASRAAKQPVVVAKVEGGEAKEEKSGRRPRGAKSLLLSKMPLNQRNKAANEELEVLLDHPLIEVLEQPNPYQARWQFVYSFISNLLLTGRAYIVMDVVGEKLQFYSLPTTWVRPNSAFTEFIVADPNSPASRDPKTKPLTRDQVAWAYLPDPSNPMGAMSPTRSQQSALRIEDKIQSSQEQFFGNGIFPTALVTIGKNAHPDVPQSQWTRPRLTAVQRRQVESVIARAMQGTWNYGKPAIIDGMVEDIKPLSMGSQEMGWSASEDKVKARILSPYGMHSFILGESMPGSYSQAYVVKELHYEVVNTYLDMLSSIITGLVEKGGGDEKLMVWWEECVAVDPAMRDSMLRFLRQNNDISQNEIRAEAGLPPDEDKNEQAIVGSQSAQIVQALGLKAQGALDVDQMVALLEGMGLPTEMAKRIAGPEAPAGEQPQLGEQTKPAEEEVPPAFPPGEEGELAKATWTLKKAIAEMRKPPELIVGEVMGPLVLESII